MLYLRFYHLSCRNRSYIVWMIKLIIKIRVIYLPQLTSSTTKSKPRKSRNLPNKKHKNHNALLLIASIPPLYIWHMSQANTYPYLLLAIRPNRSSFSPTAYKWYPEINKTLSSQPENLYL